MIVCFKWKQLKKGWEKLEPQLSFLLSAGCSSTPFRQPDTTEKAFCPRGVGRGADAAPRNWGFGTPTPGSRQGFTAQARSAPECQMAF